MNPQVARKKPNGSTSKAAGCRPAAPNLLKFPYTDTGNAERLIAMHGENIRFCSEWRIWLVWGGTRWKPDREGKIRRLAKVTIRTLYTQAATITDKNDRDKAEAHARRSESANAIKAMLICAESETGVPVSASDLDRAANLLNCRSGTLDLTTGQLRPHSQQDLITKMCPVNFDPKATCPVFLKFLARIIGHIPGLIEYLQKVVGYTLTGSVRLKVLFCLFGEGNNGKTTFLELIRYMLGDYSAQVLIDSLMTKRNQESNTTLADLADLRGARFVTTSETEAGQRLAEGKLKYLTGMGEIKTCRKYENPFTFTPTHKIFMDANHRPVVRGSDPAIWNRLKLIPFTVSIPEDEIDVNLLSRLKSEASGVLTWAMGGWLAYQNDGLVEPESVRAAVDSWKTEDDPYREFFEDECEFGAAHTVPVTEIWQKFSSWAQDNGIRYPSRIRFQERLRRQGCSKAVLRDDAGRQIRSWRGVKVV